MAKVKPIFSEEQIAALAEVGRKFNESIREAMLEINRQLKDARRRRLARALDPSGMAEFIAESNYQRMIARQRRLAQNFLRLKVEELEKELRLKPEFDPRRKAQQ